MLRVVHVFRVGLNESPSEKEGKLGSNAFVGNPNRASMKALPKRKGNFGKKVKQRFAYLPPQ